MSKLADHFIPIIEILILVLRPIPEQKSVYVLVINQTEESPCLREQQFLMGGPFLESRAYIVKGWR